MVDLLGGALRPWTGAGAERCSVSAPPTLLAPSHHARASCRCKRRAYLDGFVEGSRRHELQNRPVFETPYSL